MQYVDVYSWHSVVLPGPLTALVPVDGVVEAMMPWLANVAQARELLVNKRR